MTRLTQTSPWDRTQQRYSQKGEKADDGSRTRDLQLGKLTLYQLSYVRTGGGFYGRNDAIGRAL